MLEKLQPAIRPELWISDYNLRHRVFKENLLFYGSIKSNEFIEVSNIVDAAKSINPIICLLPGNGGKEGFMLALTKPQIDFPMLNVEIGRVWAPDKDYGKDGKRAKYIEFANKKIDVIRYNPGFISSGQNFILPEKWQLKSKNGITIPDGAISAGNWIISVSAFKEAKMDTATAIAIAARSGQFTMHDAVDFALNPKVNCSQFIQHKDKILTGSLLR